MTPLETQQIEAAKKLAGLPGMDGSPWRLYSLRESHKNGGGIRGVEIGTKIPAWPKTLKPLPYLKIEDGNPRSSSAILARAGLEQRVTFQGEYPMDVQFVFEDGTDFIVSVPNGADELANNKALFQLHEINPEAYAVGMEELL